MWPVSGCRMLLRLVILLATSLSLLAAQEIAAPPQAKDHAGSLQSPDRPSASARKADPVAESYILGSQDTVLIHVLDIEEIGATAYPIDLRGNLDLPRIGVVHAAGLTADQLQEKLTDIYKEYLQNPVVSVSVAEFQSEPISILGAVGAPGIHQIKGRRTLFEVISEAGGLREDYGNTIMITRRMEWGPIPLPNATTDPTGGYSVAEVSIRSVMNAQNPQENIEVKPYDVITVPKAEQVYVIGAVKKSGGFVLSEKSDLSALQALSLAEGLERSAGSSNAKILRVSAGSATRQEIPIDLKKILEGKQPDVPLLANDILFIPTSAAKNASLRAIEAMIQIGTGMAMYGRL